jgi:hypothetical protein
MPHFEKVTQNNADYLIATATGGHYGVIHEREKSSYQADPFPPPKNKTERKIRHPERIYPAHRV